MTGKDQNIINLDSLRAESKRVIFLGKEFEVGYIPAMLSIPVLENYQNDLKNQKETDSQDKLLKENVRAVSIFCSYYEPEFTDDFILKNATPLQIEAMFSAIVQAIISNFYKYNPAGEGDFDAEKKKIGEI